MKVADAPDVILKNKIYTLLKKKKKESGGLAHNS
jgi:hypothetical protein